MRTAILLGLFLNAMAFESEAIILNDERSIKFILVIILVMMVMDLVDFLFPRKK